MTFKADSKDQKKVLILSYYLPPSRAFFAFWIWGLTRPKIAPVGCLPKPPRFLCFQFLGFYPSKSSVGCPSNPPRFHCFRFLGFYPPQIPQVARLVAFNPRAFFACFWGFIHLEFPRLVAFLTPRALFAFRFLGFYPPQIPSVWLPSQTPRFHCFGFWGFNRPEFPRLVAFTTPRAFFVFGFWGF